MAAPNYVPSTPGTSKYYESPPRLVDSWLAERPGDLPDGQPRGLGLGDQGPGQGYALKLVNQFKDLVHLRAGERWDDASAGAVVVALKRASYFGRAPVRHDLEVAFRVWGFLDEAAPTQLVEVRREMFDRVDDPHHYLEARRIAEAVPVSTLRLTPAAVDAKYKKDWASLIDLPSDVQP